MSNRNQADISLRINGTLASTLALAALIVTSFVATADAAETAKHRVYESGKLPADVRLQEPKHLNNYFPFEVPDTKAAWETRREELQRRILVANGLWPMPESTPLNPVIHGKVERPGFTVEKVYFESYPGHYVTGLLFRPADGKTDVRRPAVLCPHGHGGRLQDYGAKKIRQLIVDGAERFEKSGRYPKLARCAQLARMGCVTFIYDMLGYADSVQITRAIAHGFAKQRPDLDRPDRFGLFSTQAELRLQSGFGVQTYNSIRALDFLQQLPDVDGERMAVTGGSGGGTQTIILCAIDPRPIAAFPNGMVSTSMQGGCTCENCCLLRVGTGNVELAALFAPKPQAMTAANDWTRDMMTKGYPQLQQLYAMLGAKQNVYCRPMLHFPHNYNYVTRATMYSWMNKHLKMGLEEPIVEEDYEPLTAEEYTVWDAKHPRPESGEKYELSLTRYLTKVSDRQLAALTPKDSKSLGEFREVIGGALRSIIGRTLPDAAEIQRTKVDEQSKDGYIYFEDIVRLETHGEELPVISLFPTKSKWNGQVVLWVDDAGKEGLFAKSGRLRPEVRKLLDAGASVMAADLFGQGEFATGANDKKQQRVVDNPRESAAYTFGYNHTLFARRVHDLLTLVAWSKDDEHRTKKLSLIGVGKAGAVVAAASALAGDAVDQTAVVNSDFRFTNLKSYRDPSFLPGAVKYGDLPAMLALCAPRPLWLGGEEKKIADVITAAYRSAGQPKQVQSSASPDSINGAIDWLLSN